jgi:protease II
MLGSQDIVHDDTKLANGRVDVALQQVFRAADATYIRYSISNRTNHPYRLTTPDVMTLLPTQMPQTLTGLKNHQLRPSLADNFRAKQDSR